MQRIYYWLEYSFIFVPLFLFHCVFVFLELLIHVDWAMKQVYQIFVIKMRIKRNEKIPICKYKLQLSFPRNNEREREREKKRKKWNMFIDIFVSGCQRKTVISGINWAAEAHTHIQHDWQNYALHVYNVHLTMSILESRDYSDQSIYICIMAKCM